MSKHDEQWWHCSWSPEDGYLVRTTDGKHSNYKFAWGVSAFDNSITYAYCRVMRGIEPTFDSFREIIAGLTSAKMKDVPETPQYWTYIYKDGDETWELNGDQVINVWYANPTDYRITVYGTKATRQGKVGRLLKNLREIQKDGK